jgi:hypothetical protein
MKKVVLTEQQTDKLMKKVVNEQNSLHELIHSDPDIHFIEVRICDFSHHRVTFKGKEIIDVSLGWKFKIEYRVEPEYRKYGIKTISVYGIRGPKEIDVNIEYYGRQSDPESLNNDSEVEETIKLPLNWDEMVIEHNDESLPYFGVDDEVDIELANDAQGNLIVKAINIDVRNF